jgi:hypothetical protein
VTHNNIKYWIIQVVAHVKTLPFYEHKFNVLRGGVYMLVLWAAFSSAVISATTEKVDLTSRQQKTNSFSHIFTKNHLMDIKGEKGT